MVFTRSASQKGHRAASPLDGDARSHRMICELHIDGKESLGGGAPNQAVGAGISSKRPRLRNVAACEVAPSPPASKRRCSRLEEPKLTSSRFSAGASKKRKREESTAPGDRDFLEETVRQLKKVKVPRRSARRAEIREILPYLQEMKSVWTHRTSGKAGEARKSFGDVPAAFQLDLLETKRLLRNQNEVGAPVLIANGAMEILDSESETRPIEQALGWFPNSREEYDTADLESTSREARRETSISEIRERFINGSENRLYPWNFPDMTFPMPPAMPNFLRHPSCNLLYDIMRYIQDLNEESICPATCPHHGATAEKCETHFLTPEEIVGFQRGCRNWLGTIMLADAGALAKPHYDTFGFGTFVSCHEGEIGFSWLSRPTKAEREAHRSDAEPSDRWSSKVLRPGDAFYMPPGTRHLVFRQPLGKQTLASAVHVVRYADIVQWLTYMELESRYVFQDEDDQVEFGRVYRCLSLGTRHFLEEAKEQQAVQKFGGLTSVRNAEKLLDRIDERLRQL